MKKIVVNDCNDCPIYSSDEFGSCCRIRKKFLQNFDIKKLMRICPLKKESIFISLKKTELISAKLRYIPMKGFHAQLLNCKELELIPIKVFNELPKMKNGDEIDGYIDSNNLFNIVNL